MNKKDKTLRFLTNDNKYTNLVEKFCNNEKLSNRIYDFLKVKGNFGDQIVLDIYDIKEDDDKQYIKFSCVDLDDIIYIICPFTSEKNDVYVVQEITNESETIYNVLLLKKSIISSENIGLTKADNKYNFKFGRLFTDDKTYINLFLTDDICYEIKMDNNSNKLVHEQIINELNKLNNIPKLIDCMKIIENLISKFNLEIDITSISSYKNYILINEMNFNKNHNICK